MIKLETEEVELFRVYKKNGEYTATSTRDVEDKFALYGFLKIIIKDMEYNLEEILKRFDDD